MNEILYTKIVLKNGLDANLPTSCLPGEPLWSKDQGNLYIGNQDGVPILINPFSWSDAAELQNDVEQLELQMIDAKGQLADLRDSLDSLTEYTNDAVQTFQNDITGLQNRATADEANITTLQGQVVTINSNISDLQGQVGTINNTISTFGDIVTYNVGNGVGEIPVIQPDGKLPSSCIPVNFVNNTYVVSTIAERDALENINVGDVCVVTGTSQSFINSNDGWVELLYNPAVTSVNGYTGNVTLIKDDLGLGNVDNMSAHDIINSISEINGGSW